MSYTITTNLDDSVYNFLAQQAFTTKKTKKFIIEEALKIYQKQELKKQIEEGLKNRYNEYKKINKDFNKAQFNSIKV